MFYLKAGSRGFSPSWGASSEVTTELINKIKHAGYQEVNFGRRRKFNGCIISQVYFHFFIN